MLRALAIVALITSCARPPIDKPKPPPVHGPVDIPDDDEFPDDEIPDDVLPPADATLDDLDAMWSELRCGIFACSYRTRVTTEVCAQAAGARELPFDMFDRARAMIDSGRGEFVVERANACRAFLETITTFADACFGPTAATFQQLHGDALGATCGAIVRGIVEPGGACDADDECIAGASCPRERFPDCVGQCVRVLNVGESCADAFDDCARDAYCDGELCQRRNLLQNGEFCVDGSECVSGKCFDYSCKDESREDGECVEDGDCRAGLYCRALPPSTGQLGICQQPQQEGDACGYALKCRGNQACAGWMRRFQGGSQDGVCQALPSNVGEPCVPIPDDDDYGDTGCFADLICNPSTSACEEAPAIDAACASAGSLCGFRKFCDDGSICRAQRQHGESASAPVQCVGYFDSFQQECFDPLLRSACGD